MDDRGCLIFCHHAWGNRVECCGSYYCPLCLGKHQAKDCGLTTILRKLESYGFSWHQSWILATNNSCFGRKTAPSLPANPTEPGWLNMPRNRSPNRPNPPICERPNQRTPQPKPNPHRRNLTRHRDKQKRMEISNNLEEEEEV